MGSVEEGATEQSRDKDQGETGKIRQGEGRAETLKCCVEADGRERERWGRDGTNGAEILLEGQSPLKARDARELWTREQTEGDQSWAWGGW